MAIANPQSIINKQKNQLPWGNRGSIMIVILLISSKSLSPIIQSCWGFRPRNTKKIKQSCSIIKISLVHHMGECFWRVLPQLFWLAWLVKFGKASAKNEPRKSSSSLSDSQLSIYQLMGRAPGSKYIGFPGRSGRWGKVIRNSSMINTWVTRLQQIFQMDLETPPEFLPVLFFWVGFKPETLFCEKSLLIFILDIAVKSWSPTQKRVSCCFALQKGWVCYMSLLNITKTIGLPMFLSPFKVIFKTPTP